MVNTNDKSGETFLSRWSRRKVEVAREAAAPAMSVPAAPAAGPVTPAARIENGNIESTTSSIGAPFEAKMPQDARPQPTLTSAEPPLPAVASLNRESDFAPFMRADVSPGLRNQAMKKLFTDPHYNVMDRLDIYIDDYGKADPIPPAMLRMMNQSKALGLFEDEERAEEEARRAAQAEGEGAINADDNLAAPEASAVLPTPAVTEAAENVSKTDLATAESQMFPFPPISST